MLLNVFAVSVGIGLLVSNQSYGYSPPVHANMSEQAYDASVLSVTNGNYLSLLRLSAEQRLRGETARGWVSLGSEREDDLFPLLRPLNHFYDPITGRGLAVGTDAPNWGLELRTDGTQTQAWSIRDAREYFYRGLTDPIPSVREENLASTFRALGQVIHLIQDMAQPQHVRNDTHLETPLPIPALNVDRSRYEEYTLAQAGLGRLQFTGYPPVALPNYLSYWDAPNGSGLAEVTNQNFFSERHSMTCMGDFCAEQGYAQPTISLAVGADEVETLLYADGSTQAGILTFFPHTFIDPITNATVTNPRVLTLSLFDLDLQDRGHPFRFSQNDFTFAESQKILVPRAVGYSAGLINYFFRGQMDLVEDPNNAGQFLIENQADEAMSGTFGLYYDGFNGERTLVDSWDLSIPAMGRSEAISFTQPASPAQKERGAYVLVFQGIMGQEADAVGGAVVTVPVDPPLFLRLIRSDGSNPRFIFWDLDFDREVNLGSFSAVSSREPGAGSLVSGDYAIRCPGEPGPCQAEAVTSVFDPDPPDPDHIYLAGLTAPFGTRQFSLTGSTVLAGTLLLEDYEFTDTWSDYLMPGALSWTRGQARVYMGINLSRQISFASRGWRANWTYDYKFGVYLITDGLMNQRIEEPTLSTTGTADGLTISTFYYDRPWYFPLGALHLTGRYVTGGGTVTAPTFHASRDWAVTAQSEWSSLLQRDVTRARIDSFEYDGTRFRHLGSKNLPALGVLLQEPGFYGMSLVTGTVTGIVVP